VPATSRVHVLPEHQQVEQEERRSQCRISDQIEWSLGLDCRCGRRTVPPRGLAVRRLAVALTAQLYVTMWRRGQPPTIHCLGFVPDSFYMYPTNRNDYQKQYLATPAQGRSRNRKKTVTDNGER
jgi:hypothetical protein